MTLRARVIYLPPWRIDITVRPGVVPPVPLAELARAMSRALEAASAPAPASVGLILSDDVELGSLNSKHLGVDGPTDVLSFPLLPPEAFPAAAGMGTPFPGPPGQRPHLGDIVVSVERAAEQATQGRGGQTGVVRWSPVDEILLLVTHGALHLCGWDHAEPADTAAMRNLEQRLLRCRRAPPPA